MDINQNRPASINPVSNEKNAVPKSTDVLSGFFAGSMNAGHDVTLNCFPVMAGEEHKQYNQQIKIKLLTPLTPPYQNVYMTFRAYFVPDVRVWANAEEFYAQNKGSAETKITEIPNMGGKEIPVAYMFENETIYTSIQNTTLWRDCFASSYIPRMGNTRQGEILDNSYILPKYSILPLRGRVAIYNDWLRNKEFDSKVTEYRNNDTVSGPEWKSYMPKWDDNLDYYLGRSKRPDNYYTNYRTDIQGFEQAYPPDDMSSDRALVTWAQWESRIAEARSEAENENLLPFQVIAKIRGSKQAKEGKVQLIGENTITLNYAAVTQNAYNTNEGVREEFQVLGQQGGYSFTEAIVPVYAGFMPNEEGHIHIIANVWVDSVFESGFDRRWLNVNALDQYRPDLKDDKFDVLYKIETDSDLPSTMEDEYTYNEAIGFKRRYSEYFKLPNCIRGDLTTEGYYESAIVLGMNQSYYGNQKLLSQSSYQFFEKSRSTHIDINGSVYYKKQWKDYSDLLINKNQAIVNEIEYGGDSESLRIKGHNQIDYVGKAYLDATIPVDPAVKNNYTTWGEH